MQIRYAGKTDKDDTNADKRCAGKTGADDTDEDKTDTKRQIKKIQMETRRIQIKQMKTRFCNMVTWSNILPNG
jgi:hypothetical protein